MKTISTQLNLFISKIMCKKLILSLLLIISFSPLFAQYEFSTRNSDVPVLGFNWGLVGGGFTSMLNNRDDMRADERLDPQFMNFNWAAGVECMYWFQPNFGFGGQVMYWNGGAKYTGYDTMSKLDLKAKAEMTYLKVPLMFYFKSYNRYKPNQRVRMNICFGPYIALLSGFADGGGLYNEKGDEVAYFGVDGKQLESGGVKGKINGNIYNPIDIGFVLGIGAEARLGRKTIVALTLRTDVGISNVENTKGLKITYDGETEPQDFKYWEGYYAKYIGPTPTDITEGYGVNRRATKNFSIGAFLTIKRYF